MVDNEQIAFSPVVEISFISKDEQKWLLNSIERNQSTPSLSQAQELKKLSRLGELNKKIDDTIYKGYQTISNIISNNKELNLPYKNKRKIEKI